MGGIAGIVFDGVRVISPGKEPWGSDYYKVRSWFAMGTHLLYIGATRPVATAQFARTTRDVAV